MLVAALVCIGILVTSWCIAIAPGSPEAHDVATTTEVVLVIREIPPWQPEALRAVYALDYDLDEEWAVELSDLIGYHFSQLDLPDTDNEVSLGVALCWVESGFNVKATNPTTKCAGLFQIHPIHGIDDIYDPEVNVAAGADILNRYCKTRGTLRGGLNRYGTATDNVMAVYRLILKEANNDTETNEE